MLLFMKIVNGGIEPPLKGIARWKNFKLWWKQLSPYSLDMRFTAALYNSKHYLTDKEISI